MPAYEWSPKCQKSHYCARSFIILISNFHVGTLIKFLADVLCLIAHFRKLFYLNISNYNLTRISHNYLLGRSSTATILDELHMEYWYAHFFFYIISFAWVKNNNFQVVSGVSLISQQFVLFVPMRESRKLFGVKIGPLHLCSTIFDRIPIFTTYTSKMKVQQRAISEYPLTQRIAN